jgi:D-glycero-alpha-D-manno-heptose-7-phosphate kinase
MIITRTPFRVSLFGGGTDYPAYYREHGGTVLSSTINKYCYITCRYLPPFFDHKFRIRYTLREETQEVDEIQHPSVRECLKFVGIDKGIEMAHTSDIPAMSGIGSSSSFTVGFLNALYSIQGKMVTKRKLAFDAIHVEQNLIGEHVGSQDQTAAAFGGFNKIEFGGSDGIFVQPVTIGDEKLLHFQNALLFYFTGFPRYSSEIAKEQIKKIPDNLKALKEMREMVDEAIKALNSHKDFINDFGKLLHESWQLKRGLSPSISNDRIDQIYETAIRAGAMGGKICGAGGGGFILFLVPPEKKQKVKEALKKLMLVPFRFENLGSHVIFYSE